MDDTPRWVRWLRNQFSIVYVAIVTGYSAAIAAGWAPGEPWTWIIAGIIAGAGVLLYQNVTPATEPVRALPLAARRF